MECDCRRGCRVIPDLPVGAIRSAILHSDWSRAQSLLANHHQAVQAALADQQGVESVEGWQRLLGQQERMATELKAARDETDRLLQDLSRQRRGARAYLAGGVI